MRLRLWHAGNSGEDARVARVLLNVLVAVIRSSVDVDASFATTAVSLVGALVGVDAVLTSTMELFDHGKVFSLVVEDL